MTRISAALLVALLVATRAAYAAAQGTVAGTVVSFQGARTLNDVNVSLVNVLTGQTIATTRPDKAGAFSFRSVPPGEYGVEAINKTACDISRVFDVSQGSMTVLLLRLKDKELCSGPIRFA